MAGETEKLTLNLGPVDLGQIDLLVQEGFYSNRTDFIRTAIRNQVTTHAEVVRQTVARKTLVLGLQHYSRQDLEVMLAAGETLRINVLGLASIADDVSPELALATIDSVAVLGTFRANEAVRRALGGVDPLNEGAEQNSIPGRRTRRPQATTGIEKQKPKETGPMVANTMNTGMLEATRLTREGRLDEATALLQRILRGEHAPPGTTAERTETQEPIETTYQITASTREAEAPAVATTGAEKPASAEAGAVLPVVASRLAKVAARFRRVPAGRPLVPKFSMPPGGVVLPGMPAVGPGHAPAPLGATVLAGGRWIAGTHTGAAGTRAYKLYIPSEVREQAMPLVVMLHGCTQHPDDFAAGTGMNVQAEAGGFLVLYPEQASSANISMCWNWFQAGDQSRDQGEPSLIAGITRQVMAEYAVDPGRVYVAGLSAGGAMAAIMAATYPDLYAAVGVHSGLAPGSAQDLPSAFQAMRVGGQAGPVGLDHAIPLIVFHGDSDPTVHSINADQLIRQWVNAVGQEATDTTPLRPAEQEGQAAGGRSYTRTSYPDVSGQTIVEHWTVHGAGHAWSGGSLDGSFTDPSGPDATRELVRFFLEHPRRKSVVPSASSISRESDA